MWTYPFTAVLWVMSTWTSLCGHSFLKVVIYGKHVFTLKELVINSSLLYSFLIYEESSTAYSKIGGSHVLAILAFGRWKQKDQEVQGCPWQGTKFEVILGSMRPCLTNSGISFLPGVIPTHCPSEQTTFPDCSWLALHLALCADTLEGHHLARAAYAAAVTYVYPPELKEKVQFTLPGMCSGALGAGITRKEEAHRQWSLDKTPCGGYCLPRW